MTKIKAVLFDMDGLMIDSEPLHLQAFNNVLEKYGKHLTEEENTKRYVGFSKTREDKTVTKKLRNNVVALPGLMELLTDLKKDGYKIAIASSSRLETIKIVIGGLKISSLIGIVASTDEVEHGKPAPDVYLLAAKKLGMNPLECLVLEDAPRGVEAGKSAGMKVFAIPSSYTKGQDFSKADKVLTSLSEVFSLL